MRSRAWTLFLSILVAAIAGALLRPVPAEAACLPTPACLEAAFPGAYAWGELAVGPGGNQSAEQVITVQSNEAWGVRVNSDQPDGRMREWNGSAYVAPSPRALSTPIDWALTRNGETPIAPTWAAISSTPATATANQPSTCDPVVCSSKQIGVSYRQIVTFADAPAGPNDYRVLVTFEASHGF